MPGLPGEYVSIAWLCWPLQRYRMREKQVYTEMMLKKKGASMWLRSLELSVFCSVTAFFFALKDITETEGMCGAEGCVQRCGRKAKVLERGTRN